MMDDRTALEALNAAIKVGGVESASYQIQANGSPFSEPRRTVVCRVVAFCGPGPLTDLIKLAGDKSVSIMFYGTQHGSVTAELGALDRAFAFHGRPE